jgi:Na+/phosphate symporter
MGTSLSDKAWGRESAVYRITGVFSVIGGWFFTALSAFTVAFLIAVIINYGGFVAILVLIGLAAYFVYRTHRIHKQRYATAEADEALANEVLSGTKLAKQSTLEVVQVMNKVSESFGNTIEGLGREDFKKLKKTYHEVEKINRKTKTLKDKMSQTVTQLEEHSIDTGHYYVQVLDYLREIAHSITYIAKPVYDHVDNNHKPFIPIQQEEMLDMTRMIRDLNSEIVQCLKSGSYDELPEVINQQQKVLKFIDTLRKKQVKRIKQNEVGTRNSMLFLGILSESKNMVLQSVNLLKSHRDYFDSVSDEALDAIN